MNLAFFKITNALTKKAIVTFYHSLTIKNTQKAKFRSDHNRTKESQKHRSNSIKKEGQFGI